MKTLITTVAIAAAFAFAPAPAVASADDDACDAAPQAQVCPAPDDPPPADRSSWG